MVDAPAARRLDGDLPRAEGWRTWAVPRAWASEPDIIETSYTMNAAPGDPSTIRQRILASIPGRLIVFRTVKAPDGFPNFDTFRQTTGVIELEPIGESRTHVRLTGAGYADTEAGRQLLGFFRDGNRTSLEQLRQRFVDRSDRLEPASGRNHEGRMTMPEVNYLAVLLCGVSSMVLGAIWYAPPALRPGLAARRRPLRRDSRRRQHGDDLRPRLPAQPGRGLGLRHVPRSGHGPWPVDGAGAAAGLFWVAASFGISYLFERRGLAMWLINGGYHAVQFTLFGLILGLMS